MHHRKLRDLADRLPLAVLLNYGCAGAHRVDLEPGDVILGERVVHISTYVVLQSGERLPMGFDYHVGETRTQVDSLSADRTLLDRIRAAADRMQIPSWPGSTALPRIFMGTVTSADVWTQHGDSIRSMHDRYGSLCEEMEAAAVAQVAAVYGIPFLAVKGISNNELRRVLDDLDDQLGLRAALAVEALILALD